MCFMSDEKQITRLKSVIAIAKKSAVFFCFYSISFVLFCLMELVISDINIIIIKDDSVALGRLLAVSERTEGKREREKEREREKQEGFHWNPL